MNTTPKVGDRVRWRRRVWTVVQVNGEKPATLTIANDDRTEFVGVAPASVTPAPAPKPK